MKRLRTALNTSTVATPSGASRIGALGTATLVLAAVALGAPRAHAHGSEPHGASGTKSAGQSPKVAAPSSKAPLASAHTSSHAAIGQKANGSGIAFSAQTPKTMAVGSAQRVTLRFDAAGHEGATARVQVPEGLTVTRADGTAVGDIALEAGRATQFDVIVTAHRDGTEYFDVITQRADNKRSSIQSVAIRAGTGQVRLKPNGTLITTPEGERIVSMPASQ
jgi:hypothetical protein